MAADNGERATGRDGRDPSEATGATILREITMLEEKLSGLIDGLAANTDTRFEANDKAIDILSKFPTELDKIKASIESLFQAKLEGVWTTVNRHQIELDRVPAMRNEAVEHLNRLVDEKFSGISTQFKERDTREERTAREGKEAIAAALQAQKEAVGKTETGFEKRMDGISEQTALLSSSLDAKISAVEKSADSKIADIKDRITSIEGTKKGAVDLWGYILGLMGAAALVVSVILAIQA